GGIHVRAGSERVRILENVIAGGGGNGVTLGGDLDPVAAPPGAPGIDITVGSAGGFVAVVQDEQGRPLAGVDVYLEAKTIASDRSDAQGLASVKVAPGTYALSVSPRFRVVRILEARD